MSVDPLGDFNRRKAWRDAHKNHGVIQSGLDSIWHWLNGVASGVAGFFTGTVEKGFKTVWATIETLVDAYQDFLRTYFKLYYWIQLHVLKYLFHLIMHKYDVAIAKLNTQVKRLIRLIYVTTNQVLVTALHAVRAERRARVIAIARAEALAKRDVRLLHQTIEREASSAYRVQYQDRVNLIVRVLEFAVTRNPELRAIVGDAITGILDLISVDNPLARLAIGFILRDVIDKLGVDKLVGHLASDLLAPLLGKPRPRNLHDVVLDMGQRLVAAERFEATFTEDGGAQVEQAGKLWRDLTQPAAAAAIVAFMAAGATHPDEWAKAIQRTLGRTGNDLIIGAANLIKGA